MEKKLFIKGITIFAVLATSLSVSAVPITQTKSYNLPLGDKASRADTFDIRADLAANPGILTSGFVVFNLQDDGNDAAEKFTVSFEGGPDSPQTEIPGSGLLSPFNFPLSTALLNQILGTGTLSFLLRAIDVDAEANDFIFVSASVTLISSPLPPPNTNVPDGGATTALLGLGLLGLAVSRRAIRAG